MSEILTMEEIEKKFDGEWVLIEDVEANEQLEVLRGKVTYHGKDRNELHRRAKQSESNYITTRYIGKTDMKMEFMLGFQSHETI
jgi:Asp-tRNA(Asn)/Glu-tRNA(Gln) amidotransferase C subunit